MHVSSYARGPCLVVGGSSRDQLATWIREDLAEFEIVEPPPWQWHTLRSGEVDVEGLAFAFVTTTADGGLLIYGGMSRAAPGKTVVCLQDLDESTTAAVRDVCNMP